MSKQRIYFRYGLIIIMGMLLTACSGEHTPEGEKQVETNKLSAERTSVEFDADRSTTVAIKATEDLGWEAKPSDSWISVSPSSGNGNGTITITCDGDNPKTVERAGSVIVSSTRYSLTTTISVKQKGTTVTASQKDLQYLTAGGDQTVTITSNARWALKSMPEWLSASASSGNPGSTQLTITAASNPNDGERIGDLVVETVNGVTNISIHVIQAPVILTTDVHEVSFNPEGGSATVYITANGAWAAASNASWCRISPQQGTGDGTLGIVADSHSGSASRTAVVTLRSGQTERTVNVVQAAATLSVSQETMTFAPAKGSQTVVVESNTQWTATSSDDSWCSVAPDNGSGDGNVSISVKENTKAERRTATVTLKAGALTRDISVTQEGISLELGSNTLAFGPQGQATTIALTCNATWTASINGGSWCEVTPASGSGNSDIRIAVGEHTGNEARQATITIMAGEVMRQVNVAQAAPYIRLTPSDELSFGHEADSKTLTVSSNVAWTAVSSDTHWCTLTKSDGQGDGELKVTVTGNTVPDERTATISVQGGGRTATVAVKQHAADVIFSVTPSTLQTYAAEGGEQTVTLAANVAWQADAKPDWIGLSALNGQTTQTITITAAANTRNKPRSGNIVIKGDHGTQPITISVTQQEAIVAPGEGDNPLPNYSRKK